MRAAARNKPQRNGLTIGQTGYEAENMNTKNPKNEAELDRIEKTNPPVGKTYCRVVREPGRVRVLFPVPTNQLSFTPDELKEFVSALRVL